MAGVLTREQARTHPRRNIVTRALGSAPSAHPDHWLLPAIVGDRFLICSDGLFGELPDEVILPLLAVGAPRQSAEALVAAANDAGGRDNVTAVVVDIARDAGPADETVPLRAQQAARPSPPGGHTGWGGAAGPGLPASGHDGQSPVRAVLPEDVGLLGLGLVGPDPDRLSRGDR